MAKKCLLVGSVGSLKALCGTVGTFYALEDAGYEVVGMVGSSGGSIALPILSMKLPRQKTIELLASVNGDKIKDNDIAQQGIDWVRKKLGFPRKGDQPFTGLLRGNGIKNELRRIYQEAGCENFDNAIIPFAVVTTKIAVPKDQSDNLIDNPTGLLAASLSRKIRCVFSTGSVLEPIRASTAIPAVFRPEKINNEIFVDGGVVEAIPVLSAIELYGMHDVFVADSTTDILEEPLYAEDVDSVIEVIEATIHTLVRHGTLTKLKEAQDLLDTMGKKIIRIDSRLKIKMTETDKIPEKIAEAYRFATNKIKEYEEIKNAG